MRLAGGKSIVSMKLRSVVAVIVCCLILIRLVEPVKAAGTVTNCTTYGGGPGSLQNALIGGGLITFACSGTIIVPEINITQNTTLDATGQTVILDGNNTNRILLVTAPLILEHLTFRNGNGTPAMGGEGAIATFVDTQINDSTITGNMSVFGGGVVNGTNAKLTITNTTITGNTAINGAGVYNLGILTIINSDISGNTASNGGGGIYNNTSGDITVRSSTISNNAAVSGGGIFVESGAKMQMRESTISGNSATNDGSAVFQAVTGGITTIACSNISGNGGGAAYSVTNLGGLVITARANWWGAANGPGGVGPGAGDSVSTLVDFSGFLAAPATPAACPIVVTTSTPVPNQPAAQSVPLCADLDGTTNPVVRVSLPLGVYGVYCSIIAQNRVFTRTPAEVGVQSVLDRGVIHAVDVFSPSNASAAGVLICLEGEGDLIFLDAAGAPRVPQPLPVQLQDGFSCAVIPNVGTVVLVQNQ